MLGEAKVSVLDGFHTLNMVCRLCTIGQTGVLTNAVQTILFLAPLAFDQVLEEAPGVNKLVGSSCPDFSIDRPDRSPAL